MFVTKEMPMRSFTQFTVASALVLALAAGASAAVYQSFTGPFVISGGGAGTTIVDTTTDTGNWIDNYKDATDSGALYYAWDWTVNNNAGETGGGGFFGGLQLYEGGTERLGVGNAWTSTNIGTFAYSEVNLNPTTAANSGTGTVRLAVQVDYLASTNDQVKVWLNPVAGVGITQAPTITTSLSGASALFDNIHLRTGNDPAQTTFANISFGQNFSDVVGVDSRIVFADDFGESDGTFINAKSPDVGGNWSEIGTGLQVNNTAVDTVGAGRAAFASFTTALSAGNSLVLDFQSVTTGGNLFSGGYAGISLYTGGTERIFIGDRGDTTSGWGLAQSGLDGVTSINDEAIVGRFIYEYDTGDYKFFINGNLELSGSIVSGMALDRLRIANGNGGDIAVSELAVRLVVPAPAALPTGLLLLGTLALSRRRL